MNEENYPTGVHTQVFLAEGENLTLERLSSGDHKPLDVKSIKINEDGGVVPLFNYFEHKPRKMAYTTRMISGALEFNFSKRHLLRFRAGSGPGKPRGSVQAFHGDTLYVESVKMNYQAIGPGGVGPMAIRELIRLDQVWEHPFQHTPDKSATEISTFTAHAMQLVEREEAQVPAEGLLEFVEDTSRYDQEASSNPFEGQSRKLWPATITKVTDGDTFKAVLDSNPGQVIDVRLNVSDAPETPKKDGKYKTNRPGYWVDSDGNTPEIRELDEWGCYVTHKVKEKLEGKRVVLIADSSTKPQGQAFNYQGADDFYHGYPRDEKPDNLPYNPRYLFQVQMPDSNDLGEWLTENGWAVPLNYDTGRMPDPDNEEEMIGRRDYLYELYLEARENGRGVFGGGGPPVDGGQACRVHFPGDYDFFYDE